VERLAGLVSIYANPRSLLLGFTLWLGSYLLARNSEKITVQLTGWGMLAYAVALVIQIIFNQFHLIILLYPCAVMDLHGAPNTVL